MKRGPITMFGTADEGGYGNVLSSAAGADGGKTGLALVFSVIDDGDNDKRKGGERDQDRIRELLTRLNFEVMLYQDPTASQVDDHIFEAKKKASSSHRCFMCVIMAHGSEGKVCVKGGDVMLNTVFDRFRADVCPALSGRPKIFIVNACRGHNYTTMIDAEHDDAGPRGLGGQDVRDLVEHDLVRRCRLTSG